MGVINLYKSDYSYDLDGNLQTLNRWGFKATNQPGSAISGLVYKMDELAYQYAGNTAAVQVNNRLTGVTDKANHVAASGFTNDIAYQASATPTDFTYDQTGNLTADATSGVSHIVWDLYGKVTEVDKSGGGPVLRFGYDPMRQRLYKKVSTTDAATGMVTENTEYYIRAADGNILAVYRQQSRYKWPEAMSLDISKAMREIGGDVGAAVEGSVLGGNDEFISGLSAAFIEAKGTGEAEAMARGLAPSVVAGAGGLTAVVAAAPPRALLRAVQGARIGGLLSDELPEDPMAFLRPLARMDTAEPIENRRALALALTAGVPAAARGGRCSGRYWGR